MSIKKGFKIIYFNCTIQELKHDFPVFCPEKIIDFNCTIQELKQLCAYPPLQLQTISIAPYRN